MADSEQFTRDPSPRPLPGRPTRPGVEVAFHIAYWTIAVGLPVLVVWKLTTGELRIVYQNPWIGSLALVFIAFIVTRSYCIQRIGRNFLGPHAAFICPRCHYPLRKLADEGICPECGTSYTRAAVVSLWETAFGLKPRYPRAGAPSHGDSARRMPAPTAAAATPWTKWSFEGAISLVETGARRRGYRSMRCPVFASELDAATQRLGRPLPADLFTFLGWFDPGMWSHFLAKTHQGTDPTSAKVDEKVDAWSDWAAPQAAPGIVIRPPALLRMYVLVDAPADRVHLVNFRERLAQLCRHPTWPQTQLIEIADAEGIGPIYYCSDPPDLPRGSIITFFEGELDRFWLADSLSQWLTRLSACDGNEVTLSMLGSMPPKVPFALEAIEHLRKQNPRSAFTRPATPHPIP